MSNLFRVALFVFKSVDFPFSCMLHYTCGYTLPSILDGISLLLRE